MRCDILDISSADFQEANTVPDPEMGHLAGILFVEHFEVHIRVGSDNKIELELSQLFS
jgi:hypothetical protein